ASVVKCTAAGRIAQVGVEDLRIVAPPQEGMINQPHHSALRVSAVEDGWVRNVAIEDTVNSVNIGRTCRRVTVADVSIRPIGATGRAATPADFAADGSQVLFLRCSAKGNNVFFFVTGAQATGPNVLLQCAFEGDQGIQPHQRWATGLLIDGCRVKGGS